MLGRIKSLLFLILWVSIQRAYAVEFCPEELNLYQDKFTFDSVLKFPYDFSSEARESEAKILNNRLNFNTPTSPSSHSLYISQIREQRLAMNEDMFFAPALEYTPLGQKILEIIEDKVTIRSYRGLLVPNDFLGGEKKVKSLQWVMKYTFGTQPVSQKTLLMRDFTLEHHPLFINLDLPFSHQFIHLIGEVISLYDRPSLVLASKQDQFVTAPYLMSFALTLRKYVAFVQFYSQLAKVYATTAEKTFFCDHINGFALNQNLPFDPLIYIKSDYTLRGFFLLEKLLNDLYPQRQDCKSLFCDGIRFYPQQVQYNVYGGQGRYKRIETTSLANFFELYFSHRINFPNSDPIFFAELEPDILDMSVVGSLNHKLNYVLKTELNALGYKSLLEFAREHGLLTPIQILNKTEALPFHHKILLNHR